MNWLLVLTAGGVATEVSAGAVRSLGDGWGRNAVAVEELSAEVRRLAGEVAAALGPGMGGAFVGHVDKLLAALAAVAGMARS
ncbi:hypothetical protein, partial [Lentzea flava]